MDKMEILKLAFANTSDPKAAMELAREMEAFLKPENPTPRWVAETVKGMSKPQPEVSVKPRKNRQPWTEHDLRCLENLIVQNYALNDMPAIMGRSRDSIKSAIMRLKSGEYTSQITPAQQVNAGRFPGHTS